mmetsp:Transcript_5895/g.18903  ORF Transcript_5895/g.18903 Transcript_5895/m.18903 type:complete len:366 (+) Transcript_5895:78-1175(+)
MAASDVNYWKIVGGADKGGIIVRSGREVSSAQAAQRLATGAVVIEKDRSGDRIEYNLVLGNGPMVGWIALSVNGKELVAPCEKPDPMAALEFLKDLRDPSWSGELEVNEMDIGGLKAMVRHRPEGVPKAPVSVLMLPGNPVLNSYSADMPLPCAMDEAFGKSGFPVVRFDWNGVGMNKFTGHPLSQDYADKVPLAYMMFEVAKHLGERVVLCSWNYSGTVVTTEQWTSEPGKMFIETLPEVCALVSLSFAYKQWEFVQRFVNEEAGLGLKYELESHSRITVPALYIFGNKDVHTPEEDVRRVVESRPDGGEAAEIYVIDQTDQKLINTLYFMLKDREAEAACKAARWLSKLRADLVAVDSPFAGA